MPNTDTTSNDSANTNAALADVAVDQTVTSNTGNNDISFDDAFKTLADNFEKTGSSSYAAPSEDQDKDPEDSSNVEVDSATITNSLTNTANNSTPTTEQKTSADTPTSVQKSSTSAEELDYRQLYEKTKRDSEAQLGLLYNRMNEMADNYQRVVKEQKQNSAAAKEAASSPKETSAALKELYEVYPEIAEAVTQLIDTRLKETTDTVEDSIERRVAPVQQHLAMSAQQQHLQSIMQTHKDLPQIVQSGALNTWVEHLDPVSKAGATNIMQYGSSDEVIALISMFKENTSGAAPAQQNNSGSFASNTTPSGRSAKEATVVKKMLNALAVDTPKGAAPTTRPTVNAPRTVDYNSTFNALAKDYEQNVWHAKRF